MKRNALFNMIEQQIRPWEVNDPRVLQVLHKLPRAGFLPDTHAAFAYADTDLPLVIDGLDVGVRLLPPRVMARLLQTANVQLHESVAQLGLNDCYFTALLANFAKIVTVYEANESVLTFAQNKLNQHHIRNVNYELNDGLKSSTDKFDVLILTGSVASLSEPLLQRVPVGGRIIAVIGEKNAPIMQATLVQRVEESRWQHQVVFETQIPALPRTKHTTAFNF